MTESASVPRRGTAAASLKQRDPALADDSRETRHRRESDVRVAGFDPRNILLRQAGPFGQLSLGQTSFDSGRAEVLAKDGPQIFGNGPITPVRYPRRPPPLPAASPGS